MQEKQISMLLCYTNTCTRLGSTEIGVNVARLTPTDSESIYTSMWRVSLCDLWYVCVVATVRSLAWQIIF